jgi:alkanesulfonate monooxygenase SsuD/methylene tetrahydromethanopterin reductase-like flavin-dependent oxidoreductase (luciferase family)
MMLFAMPKNLWTVLESMPGKEFERAIREAEDAGLQGVWIPQLFSPPFPAMAAAAMVCTRLQIGSGVALAFTRSPVETALSALEIDVLSGGRTVLGLGTSIQMLNEKLHGVVYGKPLAHLREVVRLVRDVIERGHTGELGACEGEYHRLDASGFRLGHKRVRKSIPIYLPALFESSIRLAGEIGDGLAGHPVWSLRWVENEMRRSLDQGLLAAGKKREDFHVNIWSYVAIDPDRRRAIDDARGTLAFYSGIAQYERYFAAHGFGDAARAVAAATAKGNIAQALAAVPDEMVTTFMVAGTRDDVCKRIEALARMANSLTLVPPGTGGTLSPERVIAYRRAIGEAFYPTRSSP